MVEEEEIVSTAAAAAERVIFSRYDTGDIIDYDVTVRYVDHEVSVDVYLDLRDSVDATDAEIQRVAQDAARAAGLAADDFVAKSDT